MPRLSSNDVEGDNLILVHHLNDTAIVDREELNKPYDSAMRFFRTLLPSIRQGMPIQSLAHIRGNTFAVSPGAWMAVCKNLNITEITLIQRRSAEMMVYVNSLALLGDEYVIDTATTASVYDLKMAIQDAAGLCPNDIALIFGGQQMDDDRSLRSYNVGNESTIHFSRLRKFAKPVIYLSSPIQVDATVRVSLTKDWSFSALYPVVPSVSSRSGESATWIVQVRPDGVLQEIDSGTEVPYLFWEALTNAASISTTESGQMSPPPSPVMSTGFNPCRANSLFSAQTCVALTIKDTPQYLDHALKDLGLNIEARASFITYWLPSFLKHEHILLTFVPMDAYEKAAPLDVSPKPDTVTRVFMVFKRLCSEELDAWEGSRTTPVEEWRSVIGVPAKELQDDARLFRVLEWGGMEVV